MNRHMIWLALLSFFAATGLRAAAAAGADEAKPPRELWLYYATNLAVDANIEKARQIWGRAAKAGYTHVLLTDSKLAKLGDMDAHYFRNAEQAKRAAADLGLTIVPALFDVGYSNNLLWHDPNLAEGLPVKDSLFVVEGGRARLVPDPPVALGRPAFVDSNVAIEGAHATFKGGDVHARFAYKLKVPEYRCYHVSVKIKTADYTGRPEVKALAGKWELQWQYLGVKKTQDWTEHHVVFNTLDHPEVILYFGVWENEPKGSLEMKDWKIEEVGLLNVLRRPGAPLFVKSAEDGKELAEGKDFEKVEDPRMGNVPWKGAYEVWHEPPAIRTALKDGTRLRVSWYHPAIVYDEQVCACIGEPKLTELLTDEARRVKALFGAPGYMMSHDEFRVLGWDESCQQKHETPGQMLAENVRQCRELLRPQAAYVWSDMFDPHHNAVPGPYYLVNGPWTDSWKGLDKDVIVVNWNYGHRDDSLKFFADLGNRQLIAGYYDGGQDARKWLESAAKVKGVVGIMYTTWRNDYSQIEQFAKSCRE